MFVVPVTKIKSAAERAFLIEQVNIYVRLVQCYAEIKNEKIDVASENSAIISELTNIGFIENRSDVRFLLEATKKDLYQNLLNAVNYVLSKGDVTLEGNLTKLRNLSREECTHKAEITLKPTIVDLFCGAGGLSLGFIQSGYKVVVANDILDECCETYRYNHPEIPSENVIKGDIRQILDEFERFGTVDMVIGGPPCQGFSSANQQRIIDDPRNKLYKYFIEAVKRFAPKVVVMENVKGMLSVADQVIEDYQKTHVSINGKRESYTASYRLFNAENFGVPQHRERLIYIAIRSDIAAQKNISPEGIYKQIEDACKKKKHYILQDALDGIKPLDSPRIKGRTEIDDELTGKKIDVNEYSNNEYINIINQGRVLPFVFNHKSRYASDTNYEIFRRLEQGDDATNEKIADIMPYAHRNHIFKDKYYKLIANKPCRTITAHLKMDCLSHIHPTQIRTITPREAARVQSFPDDYLFMGAYLKTYMQIGNAVPPLMARQIAEIIKKYIA